jgi:polar amino acid transport system substrate-binding protein
MAVNFHTRAGRFWCGIAFVFLSVLVESSWAEGERLNIVTEEWAPYNYSDNGSLKGFSVDIARAIAKDLKADIDIQIFPSIRAKLMLEGNPRTMMITMLRTAEREDKYKWVGPLVDSSIYFYKKKGDPLVITTLEDVKKVRSICTRQAGLVFDRLMAAGFSNLNPSAVGGSSIYQMLINGRCDLAISDSPLGVMHVLKQMNYSLDAVVRTPVKFVELPAYIACSKDIPDAEIARWQKALDKIKVSDAYKAMVRDISEK